MKIIDGKKLAAGILSAIKDEINLRNLKPRFHCLLVGDDSASRLYIKRKQTAAAELGIDFTLHQLTAKAAPEEVRAKIKELNSLPDGYIIQLPLPEHLKFYTTGFLNSIDPSKDADGLTEANRQGFLAGKTGSFLATPMAAVMALLASLDSRIDLTRKLFFKRKTSIDYVPKFLKGKRAVIISDGNVFGPTLATILENGGMTAMVQSSKRCGIDAEALASDLIVISLGRPGFLTGDMVTKGAIVIDVGTTLVNGKTKGDADWDSVSAKASAITPVPGGVGPVTVAMLFVNLLFLLQRP